MIAVDLQEHKLGLSEKYGADITINAKEEDAVKKAKKITRIGSDIVIEAAGNKENRRTNTISGKECRKDSVDWRDRGAIDRTANGMLHLVP